ncbi:MAG: IS110 family transposase [Syntrophales bacterium]|jgi:hypothetical protein|nr:IS110 family transposase [Syntrophales bacterium]
MYIALDKNFLFWGGSIGWPFLLVKGYFTSVLHQKAGDRDSVGEGISKATLIVGVDIGKTFNALGFMDKNGNVLGSCAKLYNSREGFEKFSEMIEGLKAKHHLRDVIIGSQSCPMDNACFTWSCKCGDQVQAIVGRIRLSLPYQKPLVFLSSSL